MADGTNGNGAPSGSFRGRYGRWFAEAADGQLPSDAALLALATEMTLTSVPATAGPTPYESGIPAAYTYFGQFIGHDLSGDPGSTTPECPDRPATVSLRTPLLDLDALYGAGPLTCTHLFDAQKRFVLGDEFQRGAEPTTLACGSDFKREKANPENPHVEAPRIVEPRNDGHRIIAQLHDIFMRFHNRIFDEAAPEKQTFEETQREVRRHYQWVVLHDFLPKLVHDLSETSNTVGPDAFRSFPNGDPYTPLEFAAAVFRFGHSMVRANYRLNVETPSVFTILLDNRATSLTGWATAPRLWGINWDLFIDLSKTPRDWQGENRLQLAHQIDTVLVNPLGSLPRMMTASSGEGANLALRNLRRARGLRLPSGQTVARALGLTPLSDDEILIGADKKKISSVDPSLAGNCPLWVYVLAEAVPECVELKTRDANGDGSQTVTTRKLGPVGGRIVQRTIRGLLAADPESVTNNPSWKPKPTFTSDGQFGLAELISAALPNSP